MTLSVSPSIPCAKVYLKQRTRVILVLKRSFLPRKDEKGALVVGGGGEGGTLLN